MIELRNISKVFREPDGGVVAAVRNLTLDVREGETTCLIGTSGSGKTTTLRMVNRLIDATSGQILVDGTDVRQWDVIQLRRRMGYVIQTGGLFPHMTVAGNIGLLCEIEGWKRSDIDRRVGELLDLVNLSPQDFSKRYPRELSGGQRQRVGVARALALDPAHILMDEPFGALDPITREQLHGEFRQLQEKVRKTIVLVTHNLAEAFHLGDRIALMDNGEIVQVGRTEDFRARPANAFVSEFLRSHLHSGPRDG